MSRTIRILLCGAAVSMLVSISARAAEPQIKGGIEGKVSKVDVEQGTLTIARESGREQAFTVTNDTTIVGPRGGVVHRRLRDHRFHKGLPVTVVAEGDVATEVHLGFDRKTGAGSAVTGPSTSGSTEGAEQPTPPSGTRRITRFRGVLGSKSANETESTKSEPAEEEDTDFPGKVKHADPARHLLVVTLLNGKDRSFMLSRDAKFTHNGRAMSGAGRRDDQARGFRDGHHRRRGTQGKRSESDGGHVAQIAFGWLNDAILRKYL